MVKVFVSCDSCEESNVCIPVKVEDEIKYMCLSCLKFASVFLSTKECRRV